MCIEFIAVIFKWINKSVSLKFLHLISKKINISRYIHKQKLWVAQIFKRVKSSWNHNVWEPGDHLRHSSNLGQPSRPTCMDSSAFSPYHHRTLSQILCPHHLVFPFPLPCHRHPRLSLVLIPFLLPTIFPTNPPRHSTSSPLRPLNPSNSTTHRANGIVTLPWITILMYFLLLQPNMKPMEMRHAS